MTEALRSDAVKGWLRASNDARSVTANAGRRFTEETLEGMFRAVEQTGFRLHDMVSAGRFLDRHLERMPPSAAYRFADLQWRAQIVQEMFADHGMGGQIDHRSVIDGSLKPRTYAFALNVVLRNSFENSLELMSGATGLAEEELADQMIGNSLPAGFRQAAISALLMDVRPQTMALAYLSDRLRRCRIQILPNDSPKCSEKIMAQSMMTSVARIFGYKRIPSVDAMTLESSVRLAVSAALAGFPRELAEEVIVAAVERPGSRVVLSNTEVESLAGRYIRSDRPDMAATLYSIAGGVYMSRGMGLSAAGMYGSAMSSLGMIESSNHQAQKMIEGARQAAGMTVFNLGGAVAAGLTGTHATIGPSMMNVRPVGAF